MEVGSMHSVDIDIVQSVKDARASSEVMRGIEQARLVGSAGVRLTDDQVSELESHGNTCADWGRIRVAPDFNTHFVKNSHFQGDVYLGSLGQPVAVAQGVKLASGVYRTQVIDSAIDDNALVQDTRLVVRSVIGKGAVVLGVGELIGYPNSRFGLGISVKLGIETGGREVALYPEISVPVAAWVAIRRGDARLLSVYCDAVRSYTDSLVSDITLVSPGVRILHTPYIRSSYVGDRALIDSAMGIDGSVVLSSDKEPTEISSGAYVRRSVIQWGCRISSGAVVDESAILERSSVGRHGKVTSSIVGPCSAVEKGEVVSSLVGPLLAMYHQSLLIAAVWPGGRGTMGAGSLVGSNHPGRSADQEIFIGEGLFFGLGCKVKYPCDLSRAPYTILGSGVDFPPQRMEFPFSLVRPASDAVLSSGEWAATVPGVNELMPAWVITDSAYTLARTERKLRHRCRAQRHNIDPDPLRHGVMLLCRDALQRLRAAAPAALHTDATLPGLGRSIMTEDSRLRAIDGYLFVLVMKALLALWERVRTADSVADALGVPESSDGHGTDEDAPDAWILHGTLLRHERPGASLRQLLTELIEMHDSFFEKVVSSKRKDDVRGGAIIPGYADAHEAAEEDRIVVSLKEDVGVLRADVSEYLDGLTGDGPSLDAS
jgi:carbonic anhydrase/acetyltransferase-like protein (isoleucine patch superfamily)